MTQGAYDSGPAWPPLARSEEPSGSSEIKALEEGGRDGGTGVGRQRMGRYQLLKRIAVGGMAEIFLARATGIEGFEKLVVLKRILPRYAQDFRFVRMFLQEARLAATLHHANIVQVYDIGRSGPTYFFTMEYVHGVDLRHLWNAAVQAGQRIPLEQAISIATGLAAGLHYAHERHDPHGRPLGIVHRDISPSNVLVDYDGCVKIVDFGIAKASSQKSDTQPGRIRGKVSYMSPEQCLGRPLDRRSDVFSLGILLYELSTGRRLFEAKSEQLVLNRILHDSIVPPRSHDPSFPLEMEAILYKALARDPRDRYATARELQLALEAFARERRLVVSPVSLADYVEGLVGQNVDAWREAQSAGKSLLEHLTEGIKSDRSRGSAQAASGAVEGQGQAVADVEFETIDTQALDLEDPSGLGAANGALAPSGTEPGHSLVKWERAADPVGGAGASNEAPMRNDAPIRRISSGHGHAVEGVPPGLLVAVPEGDDSSRPRSRAKSRLAIVLGVGAVAAGAVYLGLPSPPAPKAIPLGDTAEPAPPVLQPVTVPLSIGKRANSPAMHEAVGPKMTLPSHQANQAHQADPSQRANTPSMGAASNPDAASSAGAATTPNAASRQAKRKDRQRAHRSIRFADENAPPLVEVDPGARTGSTTPAKASGRLPARDEEKPVLDHDTLMLPGQSEK